MRTPVALFPFCAQLLPFVKHFEELQDKYTLRRLVSPSGFGLTGRDAGYSRNHPEVGLTITDTLNHEDPTWNVLLLTRISDAEEMESAALEREAERALKSGKAVLYFDSHSAHVPKRMWELSEAYRGMAHIHVPDAREGVYPKLNNSEYNHIDVPVVLVGGLVEEADTSEVLLRLMVRLRAEGVCVTAIAKDSIGGSSGFIHLTTSSTERT